MPEHALTQSPISTLKNTKKVRRNDLVHVPHKWFEVMALHLAGKSSNEICEIVGYSLQTYYRIMNSPRSIAVRQQLLSMYQDEFEALFNKVIINIRDQLGSEDVKTQQTAQQQWLNAEKKFNKKIGGDRPGESAEDLVSRLLNVNVQVNVAQPGEGE